MTDLVDLFGQCWAEEVQKRREQSPTFQLDEYTATGRAAAAYGGKRTTDWWLDNGPLMVEAWQNWRRDTGWHLWDVAGSPAVELEVNFQLPNLDLPIKAFIDRVFVLPTGELAVVDLKTGRTPETPEQLGLYATAIEIVHGVRIKWGYFWSPQHGHGQPYDLDRWTPELFSALFNEAVAGIQARSFLPQPANGCARWCGVSRFCAVVNGEQAAEHDPLLCGPNLTLAVDKREGSK